MGFEFSFLSLSLQLVAAGALFVIARCIYRITLHPLAKFPGPPLAGLSSLYAMSWDMPIETSYSQNFSKWHDQYGPIIRIEPNHLHIRNFDAYNQVFKTGTKFSRDPAIYSFPFTEGSLFNKLHPKDGKQHRDLYMPYFSKGNVVKMEYMIREHLAKFLDKLDEACTLGKEVDLSLGFRCLTADTLMRYTYDKPFGALDHEDFKFPMICNIELFFDNAAQMWYFPNLMGYVVKIIKAMPLDWVKFNPALWSAKAILVGCRERVVELQRESIANMTPSVFQTAFHPKPEKGHPVLSTDDMAADALVMFTAGTDTTAHAFVTGTWNLMNNPECLRKLQQALKEAIPDPNNITLDWTALEKIDYLRAIVKESIRLSYGVPGKIPRQTPPGGATMCGQHIPAGTMLSMSCAVYHQHEPYFKNATVFDPERWMTEEKFAESEKNFIAFSRGTRNCVGMNLAYAELFVGFAYIFRRFEFVRAKGMTDRDMEWHDAFVVATFGHLRVNLKRVEG